MVEQPEDSNQKNLLRCEHSEDSNQNNLFRRVADLNQHDPKTQECVGKVKIMKTDFRF